jgi:hypothetical protein
MHENDDRVIRNFIPLAESSFFNAIDIPTSASANQGFVPLVPLDLEGGGGNYTLLLLILLFQFRIK